MTERLYTDLPLTDTAATLSSRESPYCAAS
jgi:hypothetical protein